MHGSFGGGSRKAKERGPSKAWPTRRQRTRRHENATGQATAKDGIQAKAHRPIKVDFWFSIRGELMLERKVPYPCD